jgi:protein-tyrosine phosphatase
MICHTILPGKLYQRGDMLKRSREDKMELLQAHDISVVVGLAGPQDEDLVALLGSSYLWHPIPDSQVKDPNALMELVDRVADMHELFGGAVLTYCHAGRNRSGLFSALLVMRLTGCIGDTAITRVRAGRPNALANPHFVDFIRDH